MGGLAVKHPPVCSLLEPVPFSMRGFTQTVPSKRCQSAGQIWCTVLCIADALYSREAA